MYAFGAMFSADFKSMRTFYNFKAEHSHLNKSLFYVQKCKVHFTINIFLLFNFSNLKMILEFLCKIALLGKFEKWRLGWT